MGVENTPEVKLSIELKDSEPFRKAGYEVWFIWEDKLTLNKVVINQQTEVAPNVEKVCIGN